MVPDETTPADENREMARLLGSGDCAWVGELRPDPLPVKRQLAVVKKPDGIMLLMLDTDGDGKFSKQEVHRFVRNGSSLRLELKFPAVTEPLGLYPLSFDLDDPSPKCGSRLELGFNDAAELTGTVDVGGKHVKVALGLNVKAPYVDLRHDRLGLDSNGDGRIDFNTGSLERTQTTGQEAVFRIGSRYISFQNVDLKNLRFIMRERSLEDYERIELLPGAPIPDFFFTFTDFGDVAHKLSDFRGKYVLLDFWGSWCGECIARMPVLKKTYAAYHAKSFEIIGMDHEEGQDAAAASKAVETLGMSWVNARAGSVKEVIERRFQIRAFAAAVLWGPSGNIITAQQDALDGERLPETLARLLNAPQH